ncbi:MAG: TolC family outer membrane protein [Alphaproteobacteria bacterium]
MTQGRNSALAGLICAALLLPAAVGAQTLQDALVKAYLSNPSLLSARARLRVTDEGVAQALAGWRPTVSVDLTAGKAFTETAGGSRASGGKQNRSPRTGSISLEENIYEGGGTVSAVEQAESDVLAERSRLHGIEQETLLAAATAYVDVVRDREVLKLNINNERVLQRQLEATRDRFGVGEVTRTDVAQAESRLSRAQSDQIVADGNLIASRAAYRNSIGDAPGRLRVPEALGDLPKTEEEAIELARYKSAGVITAHFAERAAGHAIDAAHSDLLPTVDVEASANRRRETSSNSSDTKNVQVLLVVRVPLYQAGGVSSRIREARQFNSLRRRELDRSVRDAIESATRAWQALTTARSRIKAFTSQVRAAGIALDGVNQEAQVGSRTVLDVLDAEQEMLDARVNLVRAQRDDVVASFELRQAGGSLTAQRLGLPVEIYDFDRHYKSIRNRWYGWKIDKE